VVVCPPAICGTAQPGVSDPSNYALNIDIAPTLADLAGATPTISVDGLSLVPILNDPAAAWRSEWFMHGNDPEYEGIVGEGVDGDIYKYVELTDTAEYELYNLDHDPWELANLAGDTAYTSVETDLAARLATHLAGGPPPNVAPTAAFTSSCTDLDCDFTDTSTDSDGTVDSWDWDFGDGNTSTLQNPTNPYATAGSFTVSLTVTDNDNATHTTTNDITVEEPGSGSGSFIEIGGQVVFEAEHYSLSVDRSDHAWVETTAEAGFSGDSAMKSDPDDGTRIRADFDLLSPEMSFDVDFVTTGTYYVWLRAWAPDVRGKAMFAGLDGVPANAGIAAGGSDAWGAGIGEWTWSNTGRTGTAVVVEVAAPGVHAFQVWMGDDGVIVDKVVITTDSSFVPADEGPPESPRTSALKRFL
jgi:PKD repeat protein